MNDKVHSLLGFAQKAGKAVSGEEGLRWHAANGRAFLLILAEDARPKRVRDVMMLGEQYHIKLIRFGTLESLSQAVGRPVGAAVALLDQGIAKAILDYNDGREKK